MITAMADYKTQIDEKTGITYIEIAGMLDVDELISYVNSESFTQRTLCVVGDFRNASLEGITRGELARLVRTIQPMGKNGMRAAYVFSKGDDFGKGKLLLAQLEALGFEGRFRIFTDMEKALCWLQK